jgi:hypothetical protein
MIADQLAPIIVILAIMPMVWMAIFVHEAGHALMGWLVGFEITAFGVGLGRLIFVLKCCGVRIYFGLQHSFRGFTWVSYPQLFPSRLSQAAFLAGGVAANMLVGLMAGLLWLYLPWGQMLWAVAAVVNVVIGLPNLIPFWTKAGSVSFPTDGVLILQALRGNPLELSPPIGIEFVSSFEPFWEATGDVRIHEVNLLGSAWSWCDLGDAEYALTLIARAESLPRNDTPHARAYRAAARGNVLTSAGDPEAAAAALDEAASLFAALHHDGGLWLVSFERANLALRMGETAEAIRLLKALQSHRLCGSHFRLRTAVLVSLLSAQAAAEAATDVQELANQYATMRNRHAWLACDRLVGMALGAFYVKRGDLLQAERSFRFALQAARDLQQEFTIVENRERFRKCQGPLLAAASDCLRRLNKEEKAAGLESFFLATASAETARPQEKNREAYERIGWLLTAVNIAVGVGALLALSRQLDRSDPKEIGWVLFLSLTGAFSIFFAVIAVIAWACQTLLGVVLPNVRRYRGLTFIFGICPWLISAGLACVCLLTK